MEQNKKKSGTTTFAFLDLTYANQTSKIYQTTKRIPKFEYIHASEFSIRLQVSGMRILK
ncbi:hypothetical protein LOAG_04450 [Loa loa]|uniref:Uncharacterized protein n=1 Tax=Loa loa TaxID=7209 RepID=A0A1S0U245_LOALO|nr:hypothetical protein LOAG_04450 [Loa loa]EFO24036.1 hypothetical protein LOAG_04450 [Loa loa]